MNETIKLLKNHRSVRDFDPNKDITDAQLEEIITSALAAPNWTNGQQVSIIAVKNPKKKAVLAEAAGNQMWIAKAPVFLIFCMDYYRAQLAAEKNGVDLKLTNDIEAIIIGSTDVGIALGTAVAAAESLGLGTVPIGGIRRNSPTFIEELNLPEYVFPVSGLVIGYPNTIPSQKPRLPLNATFHKETYNVEIQRELIDEYDEIMSDYMKKRTNGKDSTNWSSKVARFSSIGFKDYAEKTSPTLKKQGFQFK